MIHYNPDDHKFWTVEYPESDLVDILPREEYLSAMDALGILPEIDLDA